MFKTSYCGENAVIPLKQSINHEQCNIKRIVWVKEMSIFNADINVKKWNQYEVRFVLRTISTVTSAFFQQSAYFFENSAMEKNVVAYLFPEIKSIAVIFRKRLHLLIEGWRCTLQPFHQVQNVIAIDGGIGDEQHECTDSSSTTSLSLLALEWNSRMFENAFKNSYTNAISDRCFEY